MSEPSGSVKGVLFYKIMVMKLTKRKGFNFFRSYYDVYNELNDKDKVKFMDALLDRQFLGIKPEGLNGMAHFAYISQTNSIDSQVKGFEDKMGIILHPCQGGTDAPIIGGKVTPSQQVEEKEKKKEKQEVEQGVIFPFDSEKFKSQWNVWKKYKSDQFNFKYKSDATEQAALSSLSKLASNEFEAIEIIHESIANGWKGFFELKNKKNGGQNTTLQNQLRNYKSQLDN